MSTTSQPRSTSIGSTPHTSPQEAWDFVRRSTPDFLTWPQLPHRDPLESLGCQLLWNIPGVAPKPLGGRLIPERGALTITDWDADTWRRREGLDAFKRSAPGYVLLLEALRSGEFPKDVTVKTPMLGLITAAVMLEQADATPAIENPAIVARLGRLIGSLAGGLVEELEGAGAGAVHCWFDEPVWPTGLTLDSALRQDLLAGYLTLIRQVQDVGAQVGIHCCAETDFGTFAGLGLDVLSFDAARYLPQFMEAWPRLSPEVAAGLIIAWGIIDTWEPDVEIDLQALWRDWQEITGRAGVPDPDDLARRSIWTPACGMGLLSETQAEAVMTRLGEFVQLIQCQ